MNACEACYICAALHKAMCSSDYRIKAIELQHSAYSNDFTFYENSDIVLFYYNLYCNENQNYITEIDRCASRLNIRKIIFWLVIYSKMGVQCVGYAPLTSLALSGPLLHGM